MTHYVELIKCKCGINVLCPVGRYKDGDLTNHQGCKEIAKEAEE